MSERGKFEDQLRAKLEAFEAPYEANDWKAYRKLYGRRGIGRLLKIWYLPYLFSAFLFGLSWLWFPKLNMGGRGFSNEARVDTLFIEKTVQVYDTFLLRDTVYVHTHVAPSGRRPALSAGYSSVPTKSNAYTLSQVSRQGRSNIYPAQPSSMDKPGLSEEAPALSAEEQERRFMQDKLAELQDPRALRNDSLLAPGTDTTELIAHTALDSTTSLGPEKHKDTAAAASTPPFGEPLEEEKRRALLAGSQEKLKAQDYRLLVGPQTRLFSPFSSSTFDTYGGVFIGMELRAGINRLELDLAAHYGFMHHEFRDPQTIPLERQALFPGYLSLNRPADFIEVRTQQLLLPMSLSYIPWYNDVWTWRAQAGALGNLLVREQFEYGYRDDDFDDIEDIDSNIDDRRFKFSHLQLGSSISYTYHRTWSLEAGISYYHPLEEKLGLSKLDPAALSLNIGWYWHFL